MPVPRAHEYNEPIELINVRGPFNATTGVGVKVSTFDTGHACIRDLGGALDAPIQQNRSQAHEYEVWYRYIDGLTGLMQIVWGAKTLVITGTPQKVVDAQGRRVWLMRAQHVTEQTVT